MVNGIDAFEQHFREYREQYAVIAGLPVDSRDIRKHRADVFRLYQLVRPAERIPVSREVLEDIRAFILKMRESEIRLKDIGVRESKTVILAVYEQMYVLKEE